MPCFAGQVTGTSRWAILGQAAQNAALLPDNLEESSIVQCQSLDHPFCLHFNGPIKPQTKFK